MKVTVLGAAGGIGQALVLLLKNTLPLGSILSLYDVDPIIHGVALDLSHISTAVKVEDYSGKDSILALQDADIILISAGVARKPGMDRKDLFNINAQIIYDLIYQISETAPLAMIGIITNPLNSMVVIAAEVLKKAGVYDKKRLFGISTLDVIRANTFVSELKGINPKEIEVKVVGGHSGNTIIPILSQLQNVTFNHKEVYELTKKIQNAGTKVVNAKLGSGSATLSMSQAASRFTLSLVHALSGKKNIIECAYVEGTSQYTRFFSQPLLLSEHGICEYLPLGELSTFEEQLLNDMIEELQEDILQGEMFIK